MLDVIESTRTLTDTGLQPDQAAAIAHVVQQAVEQGDHVTPDQFRAGIAEVRTEIAEVRTEIANLDTRLSTQISDVRTEIANLDTRLSTQISTQMGEMRTEIARSETRLIRWVGGLMLTAAGIVTAAVVAIGLAILRALAAG